VHSVNGTPFISFGQKKGPTEERRDGSMLIYTTIFFVDWPKMRRRLVWCYWITVQNGLSFSDQYHILL